MGVHDHRGRLHGFAIEAPAHTRQKVRDGHTIARVVGGDIRMRKDLNLPSPIGKPGSCPHQAIDPTLAGSVLETKDALCAKTEPRDKRADMALGVWVMQPGTLQLTRMHYGVYIMCLYGTLLTRELTSTRKHVYRTSLTLLFSLPWVCVSRAGVQLRAAHTMRLPTGLCIARCEPSTPRLTCGVLGSRRRPLLAKLLRCRCPPNPKATQGLLGT